MLYEKLLNEDLILVLYDFVNSDEGNHARTVFRNELTGKRFHAMMVTQSCYLLPASNASRATVKHWSSQFSQISTVMIFNDADFEPKLKQKLSKQYVRHLHDLVEEVNMFGKDLWKQLKEWEEKVADEDPDISLRGWATKMAGITGRFEEIQKTINRVGNEDDEFELQKLSAFVDRLDVRFEKGKELYIRNKGKKD